MLLQGQSIHYKSQKFLYLLVIYMTILLNSPNYISALILKHLIHSNNFHFVHTSLSEICLGRNHAILSQCPQLWFILKSGYRSYRDTRYVWLKNFSVFRMSFSIYYLKQFPFAIIYYKCHQICHWLHN